MPTKLYPEVPHLRIFFNISRDDGSTTSLGSLFQCLSTLFSNIQSKSPLMQLEAISFSSKEKCLPIPGNIQGQVGWGSEQPHLVVDVPANCTGVGTR